MLQAVSLIDIDTRLDAMRAVGDPLADSVVQEVYGAGEVGAVNRLMRALVTTDGVPSELPAPVRDYLSQTGHLPSWAVPARLGAASRLFQRLLYPMIAALHCASLPSCYAAAKGVQVLHLTARLATNPKRRIMETAQFLLDAMSPGGLDPGGAGLLDAQKVRLMHAAVRLLIGQSGHWKAELGTPINQEDLAGTLMSFSAVTMTAMDSLGIAVTDTEREDFIHAWNAVGFVMGIGEPVLPEDSATAIGLWRAIGRRQFAACAEGREMASALIEMMEYMLPGDVFNGLPTTLTRQLVGDKVADLLGLGAADWTRHLSGSIAQVFQLGNLLGNGLGPAAPLADALGRELVRNLAWVERGGQRAPFALPSRLRE